MALEEGKAMSGSHRQSHLPLCLRCFPERPRGVELERPEMAGLLQGVIVNPTPFDIINENGGR